MGAYFGPYGPVALLRRFKRKRRPTLPPHITLSLPSDFLELYHLPSLLQKPPHHRAPQREPLHEPLPPLTARLWAPRHPCLGDFFQEIELCFGVEGFAVSGVRVLGAQRICQRFMSLRSRSNLLLSLLIVFRNQGSPKREGHEGPFRAFGLEPSPDITRCSKAKGRRMVSCMWVRVSWRRRDSREMFASCDE